MNNNILVDEFRGPDMLYCAEVLTDNDEVSGGYVTGTPFKLAPVAEISKTTETASEPKYYDNKPASTVNAEGADTVTLTVPTLPIATLGYITGKAVDQTTGALMDGEAKPKYFALGYRLGLTDGTYRYVWRYKGSFGIPDETSSTKNAGTDTNNQSLTYTGISTMHTFEKPNASQKALVVDERDNLADVSTFFAQVTTCDTLQPKTTPTVTGIGVAPSTASITVGNSVALSATLTPAGATGEITWAVSSGDTYASVSETGVVTGLAEGTATVTATCGGYSDSCTVTVAQASE